MSNIYVRDKNYSNLGIRNLAIIFIKGLFVQKM